MRKKSLGAFVLMTALALTALRCKKDEYIGKITAPLSIPVIGNPIDTGNGNGGGNSNPHPVDTGAHTLPIGPVSVDDTLNLLALQDSAGFIPNILGPGFPYTSNHTGSGEESDSLFWEYFSYDITTDSIERWAVAHGDSTGTLQELLTVESEHHLDTTKLYVALGSRTTTDVPVIPDIPVNSNFGIGTLIKPGGFAPQWTIFCSRPHTFWVNNDPSAMLDPAVDPGAQILFLMARY